MLSCTVCGISSCYGLSGPTSATTRGPIPSAGCRLHASVQSLYASIWSVHTVVICTSLFEGICAWRRWQNYSTVTPRRDTSTSHPQPNTTGRTRRNASPGGSGSNPKTRCPHLAKAQKGAATSAPQRHSHVSETAPEQCFPSKQVLVVADEVTSKPPTCESPAARGHLFKATILMLWDRNMCEASNLNSNETTDDP